MKVKEGRCLTFALCACTVVFIQLHHVVTAVLIHELRFTSFPKLFRKISLAQLAKK